MKIIVLFSFKAARKKKDSKDSEMHMTVFNLQKA